MFKLGSEDIESGAFDVLGPMQLENEAFEVRWLVTVYATMSNLCLASHGRVGHGPRKTGLGAY